MLDDLPTRKNVMFEVEEEAFHYVKAHEIFQTFLKLNCVWNTSVADCSSHFYQKVISGSEMLQYVEFS